MMWRYPFPWNVAVLICVLAFVTRTAVYGLDMQVIYNEFQKKHPVLVFIHNTLTVIGAVLLVIYLATP